MGKLIPLRANQWRKWWCNRRSIPYFVAHLIDGGSIIDTNIVAQAKGSYKVGGGEYVFSSKVGDKEYIPYLDLYGEKLIFHYKDNMNALEFKKKIIEPAVNDPRRFASMILNKDIRDATAPSLDEFISLKRFILLALIIVALTISGVMYMLLGGVMGG